MSEGLKTYAVNIGKDPVAANNFHFVKNASHELELRKGMEGDGGAVVTTLFASGTKQLLQAVVTQTGAVVTGSTILPYDDTIPQITEGDEYMTVSITPKKIGSTLDISSMFHGSSTAGSIQSIALFSDSNANALAAHAIQPFTATAIFSLGLGHQMTTTSLSTITFRIRCGNNVAGTTTMNGIGGNRRFGGVSSSFLSVKEYY